MRLSSGDAFGFEDEGDVALEGEVREEADLLNDIADGAAKGDELAVAGVLAAEEDFAAGWLEEAIDWCGGGLFCRSRCGRELRWWCLRRE